MWVRTYEQYLAIIAAGSVAGIVIIVDRGVDTIFDAGTPTAARRGPYRRRR
ncbi:MAG TPA: hypothetical protein VFK02_27065 [Kofleriaceae bacterium]|nr:hypothetical protein [Kofleriaceae bacterium]